MEPDRKPKQVNLKKLESMSDEQLRQKLQEKEEKIKKKKEYYHSLHQTNQSRLEDYTRHRNQEAAVIANILNQRKAKNTGKAS